MALVLFDLLTGSPDTGGVWTVQSGTPDSGSFNASAGTFETYGHTPGVYVFEYTVAGGSFCQMSSTVTVTVDGCCNPGAAKILYLCIPNTAGGEADYQFDLQHLFHGAEEYNITQVSGTTMARTGDDVTMSGTFTNGQRFKFINTCSSGEVSDEAELVASYCCHPGNPINPSICIPGAIPLNYHIIDNALLNHRVYYDDFDENYDTGASNSICDGVFVVTFVSGPVNVSGRVGTNGVVTFKNTDLPGVYTFRVTCPCGDYEDVDITLLETANAGLDNTINIDINEGFIDLYGSLNGSPQTSGTWTVIQIPTLASNPEVEFADRATPQTVLGGCEPLETGGVLRGSGDWDLGFYFTSSCTGIAVGKYVFKYTVTTSCGTDEAYVTVNLGCYAGVALTDTICKPASGTTTYDLTELFPDASGYEISNALSNSPQLTITANTIDIDGATTAGTYKFVNTCPGSANKITSTVIINETPIAGTDKILFNICDKVQTNLRNILDIGSTSFTPRWYFVSGPSNTIEINGSSRTVTDGQLISSANSPNVSFPSSTGTYVFRYEDSQDGCALDDATITLSVIQCCDSEVLVDETRQTCQYRIEYRSAITDIENTADIVIAPDNHLVRGNYIEYVYENCGSGESVIKTTDKTSFYISERRHTTQSDLTNNGYIDWIELTTSDSGQITLDLDNSIILSLSNPTAYKTALEAEIKSKLSALGYTNNTNYVLSVSVGVVGTSNATVTIGFQNKHIPANNWVGITTNVDRMHYSRNGTTVGTNLQTRTSTEVGGSGTTLSINTFTTQCKIIGNRTQVSILNAYSTGNPPSFIDLTPDITPVTVTILDHLTYPDKEITCSTITLTALASPCNNPTYEWKNSDGIVVSNDQNHLADDNDTYSVLVQCDDGCEYTRSHTTGVPPCFPGTPIPPDSLYSNNSNTTLYFDELFDGESEQDFTLTYPNGNNESRNSINLYGLEEGTYTVTNLCSDGNFATVEFTVSDANTANSGNGKTQTVTSPEGGNLTIDVGTLFDNENGGIYVFVNGPTTLTINNDNTVVITPSTPIGTYTFKYQLPDLSFSNGYLIVEPNCTLPTSGVSQNLCRPINDDKVTVYTTGLFPTASGGIMRLLSEAGVATNQIINSYEFNSAAALGEYVFRYDCGTTQGPTATVTIEVCSNCEGGTGLDGQYCLNEGLTIDLEDYITGHDAGGDYFLVNNGTTGSATTSGTTATFSADASGVFKFRYKCDNNAAGTNINIGVTTQCCDAGNAKTVTLSLGSMGTLFDISTLFDNENQLGTLTQIEGTTLLATPVSGTEHTITVSNANTGIYRFEYLCTGDTPVVSTLIIQSNCSLGSRSTTPAEICIDGTEQTFDLTSLLENEGGGIWSYVGTPPASSNISISETVLTVPDDAQSYTHPIRYSCDSNSIDINFKVKDCCNSGTAVAGPNVCVVEAQPFTIDLSAYITGKVKGGTWTFVSGPKGFVFGPPVTIAEDIASIPMQHAGYGVYKFKYTCLNNTATTVNITTLDCCNPGTFVGTQTYFKSYDNCSNQWVSLTALVNNETNDGEWKLIEGPDANGNQVATNIPVANPQQVLSLCGGATMPSGTRAGFYRARHTCPSGTSTEVNFTIKEPCNIGTYAGANNTLCNSIEAQTFDLDTLLNNNIGGTWTYEGSQPGVSVSGSTLTIPPSTTNNTYVVRYTCPAGQYHQLVVTSGNC